jgi:hypothetical protein
MDSRKTAHKSMRSLQVLNRPSKELLDLLKKAERNLLKSMQKKISKNKKKNKSLPKFLKPRGKEAKEPRRSPMKR